MQDASSKVRDGEEVTAQQENEEVGFREMGFLRGDDEGFDSGDGVCIHFRVLNKKGGVDDLSLWLWDLNEYDDLRLVLLELGLGFGETEKKEDEEAFVTVVAYSITEMSEFQ